MQRQDESPPPNRRQWTRPVLVRTMVSGVTTNNGTRAHPNNVEWEGGCIGDYVNYRMPTSAEVGTYLPACPEGT